MNINFIGKEFERLARLEDFINYEYEPKTSMKYGKRNIYFEDIKLDFINEVNTYGFSPFILQSFVEQRDNPNIMRFITKKFNHGLTNYIKIQTKGVTPFSKKNKKRLSIQKSMKNLKNSINKKNIKKKDKLISNIFLIKKNEEVIKNEEKENFLHKALVEVGGHKLNISIQEESDKDNDNNKKEKKKNNNKFEENKKDKNNNNIELLKKLIFLGKEKSDINNNEKLPKLNIPGLNNNDDELKQGNLKSFLEKINKLSFNNNFNNEKKVLTLSKNRNILGNRKILSPLTKNNFKNIKEGETFNKKGKMVRNKSMGPQKMKENNKFGIKLKNKNKINDDINQYLLIAKAVPYRYMGYGNINKYEIYNSD